MLIWSYICQAALGHKAALSSLSLFVRSLSVTELIKIRRTDSRSGSRIIWSALSQIGLRIQTTNGQSLISCWRVLGGQSDLPSNVPPDFNCTRRNFALSTGMRAFQGSRLFSDTLSGRRHIIIKSSIVKMVGTHRCSGNDEVKCLCVRRS